MKLVIALILSISIHLGIYLYLQDSKIEYQTSKILFDKNQATSINYVKLQPTIKKPIQKQNSIKKEQIKKPELPKILEKPIKKDIPKKAKTKTKTKTKAKAKPFKKIQTKKIPKQIKELPKKIEPKEILTPEQKEYKKLQDTITPKTKEYISLYEDFEKLPPKTKIFILKNIEGIGAITQRHLYYPTMSAQTGQEGINVVEFMLFENGKISEPKIIKSSSYFLLDDNTLETIEAAFHEYPNPSKPTPIRIYVKYKLIRE